MLKLLNVSFHYPGGAGVNGISLELRPSDFALLVGRTGAGKTTLLKLISLELTPDAGDLTLEKFRTSSMKDAHKPLWRRRLGIVHQNLQLLEDRSVLENVRLAAICEPNLNHAKARALKVLSRVHLSHKIHSYPPQLSTGEQQRAAIARALVNEPFLLLADEPVSNLDALTSAGIIDLLHHCSQSGMAVLVATHQPERFESVKPIVYKMDDGRVFRQ
ncbi:MAG: ATP-binding cassette domain-containing protein [Calditrichaeota bacterium]|nr:ATP-binding cassette domain-containing protein [Calditrichota bacterium]